MRVPDLDWHSAFTLADNEPQWLGEGDFCRCYSVNRRYVLRVAKHPAATQALDREIALLPNLAPYLTFAIPQIQGWGIERNTEQRFVCYPMLEGTPLEKGLLENLREPSRTEALRHIARFLQELHAVPIEVGYAARLPHIDFHNHYAVLLEQAREPLQSLGPQIWRYYGQLVAEYRNWPIPAQPAILHGDLSPDHCLADPHGGRLSGIIDFGDSCIGDPLRDLIYVLEDYGPEFLNQILALYTPGNPPQAARRIQLHHELNNLEYYLGQRETGDPQALEEALLILAEQAK